MAFDKSFEENYISVSMSDIINHPWYEKLNEKPNGLEALLYSMGLDIKRSYEIMVCEHRSEITGKVQICERFSGIERQDENWIAIKQRIKNI